MSRTTLSLLGTISFDVPQDGRSGLYQSKKIAALAYLLLARGAVRRSELATLLWPESDERKARRSLNQLVLELRRDHGAEAIVARGEEDLLVDRSILTSDASLLFDAASVGDVREVVRLYRGELMPGFIADGANSYNDWLDRQREAVKGIVADSLWKMAEASDPRTAISLLEQCIALRPFDEAVLRRLMTLMSESGSTAQALARYETFKALIGEQVGASPAKATRELASSIASAPVEPLAAAIAAHVAPVRIEAPTTPSHTEAPRKRGRRLVAGTFVLAMCAAIAYAASTAARGSEPRNDSIAVATFAAETGADSAIANAISDAVAADLSKTTGARVMRAPGGAHAGLQVSGSITRSNDVYVGSTQLRDATGRILASNKLNSPVRDGMEAAASQVSELAEFTWNANRHLSPDALKIEAARAHLRRANDDFGRGADSASDMEIRSAHAQLEAVPARARGFSWDSTSAATVAQEGWRWFANDHARASANFARAAAVMRKHHTETSVTQAARYRSYQWIFDESSSSEALLDSARVDLVAWQRDYPGSASLWQEYGRVRLAQGDFVGAYDADVKARTLDPAKLNDPGLSLHIFLAAFNSRMDRAAISECDRLRHDFEGSWPAAACSVFSVGWAKAQYDLAPLLRDDALSKDPPPSRADTRPRIVALVAAAEALRGRSAVAATLMKTLPGTTDPDLLACRALALAALGRRDSAAAITTLVNARPNGKRLLRMYTRALEDVLPVGRAVATSR